MSRYKGETNYYLDKDAFSAVKAEALWAKLSDYIDTHASDFANVSKDYENKTIKLTSTNLDRLNELIKFSASDAELDKCLIRTCLLNTEFDKEHKCLKLSTENARDFENYNEVIFQIACSDGLSVSNSLFFHDSALVNYATTNNEQDMDKVLAVISYKETNSTNLNEKNGLLFLCYDQSVNNGTLVNDIFANVNSDKPSAFIQDVINNFNNSSLTILTYAEEISYSNFKIAITGFKMSSEADFLNFASYVPTPIYNDFIENLDFTDI